MATAWGVTPFLLVVLSQSLASTFAISHHRENVTDVILSNDVNLNTTEERRPRVTCEVARIKCALRRGCGTALQSYMLDCADLMQGRTSSCDEFCKASLIALTSTEEGESLMDCLCSDDFCSVSKARLEVCRKEVILANAHNAVVSCSVAHLICSADTSCSTALFYYDKHCRRMFNGRGCSFRCNNSISILGRQKKAEKLWTCSCDGSEPFACQRIKDNMAALCFNQSEEEETLQEDSGEEEEKEKGPGEKKTDNTISSASKFGLLEAAVSFVLLRGSTIFLASLLGFTPSGVVRWRGVL